MSDVVSSFGGGTAEPDPLLRFLQRVVAWSVADPPDSFVNIHAFGGSNTRPFRGGGRSFGGPTGMWEAAEFVRYLNHVQAQVFYCISAQSDYDRERSKQNRVALRKGIKARWLKAFVLDLDVKPKAYPSQRAALAAVLPFLDGLGLEPGPIVSTGVGLHVYLTLDQPIPPDRWRPLASKLANAARTAGLKADFGVTIDVARILRVPTSWNRKDPNNPAECRVLGWGKDMTVDAVEAALAPVTTGGYAAPAPPRAGVDLSFLPPRPPINGPDAERVRADLERAREATSFDLLRSVCGVVADSERRGGDGDLEPLWFELGKLMRFVQEGREWFHILSEGDVDRYDAEQTDKKFDSATSMGWPRCHTIAASSPAAAAICHRCPHFDKNQTPIHAARGGSGPVAGHALPPGNGQVNGHANGAFASNTDRPIWMPPNFGHDANRFIVSSQGQRVFDKPILDIAIEDEPIGTAYARSVQFTTLRGTEETNDMNVFKVPFKAARSRDKLAEAMMEWGVTPTDVATKEFMPDLMTQIHNMRRVRTQQRMGWIETDGLIEGFSYGGQFHGPEGSRSAVASHPFYTPRGSLKEWKQAASVFFERGLVEIETVIATAFAAPLVRFTVVDGLVVFVRSSQSGEGKSASLEIGASVWMSRQGMLTDGTMNATLARLTALNNLPLFFDEFIKDTSDQTARQAAKAILSISAGKQPARLTRNRQEVPQLPSRTMMVGTSNISLVELAKNADTNAQAARVFEIELSNVLQKAGTTLRRAGELKDMEERNFGTAGLVYAAYIGKHHKTVARWVAEKIDELQQIVGNVNGERFWISAAAAIIVGAAIATALKLLLFDVAAIQKFLIDLIRSQRVAMADRETNADDPIVQLQKVGNFLNDHIRNRIITEEAPSQGRARTPVTNPAQLLHSSGFFIRWAKKANLLLVSEVKLKDYMRKNNLGSYTQLRTVLERQGCCTRSQNKRKIGGNCGNEYATSPEVVLEFDLTKECNATLNPPDEPTGEADAV